MKPIKKSEVRIFFVLPAARFRMSEMLFAVALICLVIGCAPEKRPISEIYGTERSAAASSSLNGTSALAGLLRERGHKVVIDRRLTPAIERYGAVVWFGDPATQCPSPPVEQHLDVWMQKDSDRRFMFVGWDYDAAEVYWTDGSAGNLGMAADSAARRRARAMVRRDTRAESTGEFERFDECKWFSVSRGAQSRINHLSDRNSRILDTSSGTTEFGIDRLDPLNSDYLSICETVDDGPFAFAVQNSSPSDQQQVVVVSNGSAMLNYSLTNFVNHQIADLILAELDDVSGPILFLTSSSIEVSDAVFENVTAWSWINKPPICFIVPHFLILGMMYLCSKIPSLGRRLRLIPEIQPGFGKHVDAIGQLIDHSSTPEQTRRWFRAISDPGPKRGIGDSWTVSSSNVIDYAE